MWMIIKIYVSFSGILAKITTKKQNKKNTLSSNVKEGEKGFLD